MHKTHQILNQHNNDTLTKKLKYSLQVSYADTLSANEPH